MKTGFEIAMVIDHRKMINKVLKGIESLKVDSNGKIRGVEMTSDKLNELLGMLAQEIDYSDMIAADQLATISTAIVKERIRLGMNQKEFADHMGVSQGTVSKWESGNCNFSIETLAKICERLDFELKVSIKSQGENEDLLESTNKLG